MRDHRPVKWIMSRDGSRRSVLGGPKNTLRMAVQIALLMPLLQGWSSGVNKE